MVVNRCHDGDPRQWIIAHLVEHKNSRHSILSFNLYSSIFSLWTWCLAFPLSLQRSGEPVRFCRGNFCYAGIPQIDKGYTYQAAYKAPKNLVYQLHVQALYQIPLKKASRLEVESAKYYGSVCLSLNKNRILRGEMPYLLGRHISSYCNRRIYLHKPFLDTYTLSI